MSENGPFNDERAALSTRAAARIRAAFDAAPGVGASVPTAVRVMLDACMECGVDVGALDLATLKDIAWRETFEAVCVAGLVTRAYQAGKAAGPEGAVTEWGVQFNAPPGRGRSVFQAYGSEDDARTQAAVTPEVDGWSATLMHRQATPWTPVPGEDEGQ
jgi:hypothetical protein